MLWIYIENDTFFGPELSRRMHAAYTGAGGNAEYRGRSGRGEEDCRPTDIRPRTVTERTVTERARMLAKRRSRQTQPIGGQERFRNEGWVSTISDAPLDAGTLPPTVTRRYRIGVA